MKPVTRIVQILAVNPYLVTCQFANGEIRQVDFQEFIIQNKAHSKVKPLLNPNYFMNVTLDELGGLQWINGFDCSPLSAFELGKPC